MNYSEVIQNIEKTDHEKFKRLLEDPVLWAYVFIRIRDKGTGKIVPWVPRKYQAEALRDKAIKKVLRWGRRCGKTESQIVKIFHKCLTKPQQRVIIVTPFEHQVRAIYTRMNEILQDSDYIRAEIVSNTKNPYKIVFSNGSSIFMFTAGTKTGNGAASIRGQRADLIYIDEADYLQDNEIEAVVSIAIERPDIEIILTSTPTGKRAFFYRACTNKDMGYKEFYTPSTEIPTWNEQMEREFRAMFTEVAYQHEVLAEFGDEVTGVFNKDRIDEAIGYEHYYYSELDSLQKKYIKDNNINAIDLRYSIKKKAPYALRIIGVDWDKYNEVSTIVVTEYDEKWDKFKVVYRSDIPKGDFSLDNAVKLIVELNEIYNPAYIYCDRGFGEYQIETLRLYGKEHPETGLDRKVKGFHFSENIDIIDPVTKLPSKKQLKYFMVDQTSILFDRRRIMLSPYDEVLYRQLINYCVIKISSSGKPIFTNVDEHALDAFMLTIVGFTLEFPNITDIIEKPDSRVIGSSVVNPIFKYDPYANNSTVNKKIDYSDPKTDRPPNIVIITGNGTKNNDLSVYRQKYSRSSASRGINFGRKTF